MKSFGIVRPEGGSLGSVFSKRGAAASALMAFVGVAACSSSSKTSSGATALCQMPPSEIADAAALVVADGGTCADPGAATPGPGDSHCEAPTVVRQSVDQASCCGTLEAGAASGDDGTGEACNDAGVSVAADDGTCCQGDYGPTMYGQQGSDDDCKYDVSWTSTPLCLGAPVYFTVHANKRVGATTFGSGAPLTGAGPYVEAVLNCGPAASPTQPPPVESAPGVYQVGPIVFTEAGVWSVRFHFNETCYDLLPDSPHGHAAFWVTIPSGGEGGASTPEASTTTSDATSTMTPDATSDAPATGTTDAASDAP